MKADPCPRCGRMPIVYPNLLTDCKEKWTVKCVSCNLQSTAKRKRSAIRQWNRIAVPPLTPVEIIACALAVTAEKAATSFQAFAQAVAEALGGGSENE